MEEAGGGESEGFELAEQELIEHTSHGDEHAPAQIIARRLQRGRRGGRPAASTARPTRSTCATDRARGAMPPQLGMRWATPAAVTWRRRARRPAQARRGRAAAGDRTARPKRPSTQTCLSSTSASASAREAAQEDVVDVARGDVGDRRTRRQRRAQVEVAAEYQRGFTRPAQRALPQPSQLVLGQRHACAGVEVRHARPVRQARELRDTPLRPRAQAQRGVLDDRRAREDRVAAAAV